MQTIMHLALRADAPAPDAEQTWLFEGDVPFVPIEGADVVVLDTIAEGVRTKRVRYLSSRQEYEVILDEMDLDESGLPNEECYAQLEEAGWFRLEEAVATEAPERALTVAGAGDLTAQQAARELGVTDRRISQLCNSGALRGYKDENDHWRIPPHALRAYQNELKGLPPDGRRRQVVLTAEGPAAGRQMTARELHNLTAAENAASISQLLVQQQVALGALADRVERLSTLVTNASNGPDD